MTVFASCAAAVDVINPTSAMAATHFLVMYPSGMARREGKPRSAITPRGYIMSLRGSAQALVSCRAGHKGSRGHGFITEPQRSQRARVMTIASERFEIRTASGNLLKGTPKVALEAAVADGPSTPTEGALIEAETLRLN